MFNVISYLCFIVLFVLLMIVSSFLYKKERNETFSLLNHFPYELNSLKNNRLITYTLLLSLISLILMHGNKFLINPSNHVNYFISTIIGIVSILIDLFIFFSFNFKMEMSFKTQIIISVKLSLLVLLNSAFGIIYVLRSDSFSIYLIIPYIIFILIQIGFIINVFIKGWINFEKSDENGVISIKRTKTHPVSMLIWISIIIFILNNIIYLFLK